MLKIKQVAVFALLTASLTVPAFAADKGGVEIKGNLTQEVKANSIINMGLGNGAKAGLSAASVHGGSTLGGNVKQKVKSNSIINMALGNFAKACTSLASVGDNPACK